jgi:ABC-type transport system involved in multi-copper enzyme maturation permease subunit
MTHFAQYLWRLIPANPILLRVVETGGKKRRDLFIRCGYLGLLIAIVLISLVGSNFGTGSLAELSKASSALFQKLSYFQLALVALLAPIFTAGAITQEKDSQTYDILLSTPLSNGQIVLGSLLSRVFFVIALLVSGIPIFSITQIFGGVAISSIVLSFLIAAATALVTGALAMAIAVFKVGTRRTIFSFYLFVVIYLVGLFLLDKLPYFKITTAAGEPTATSWFTAIHPFLALRVIFNDPEYMPPEFGALPEGLRFWPIGWYLSNPASFYINFMFFLSVVLVIPSIIVLRRIAQSSSTLRNWFLQKVRLSTGDRKRKPRVVWHNPIAWREAKTKASAARASVLRYGFIAVGMVGAVVLVVLLSIEEPVDKYIDNSSYNPTTEQLSIYTTDKAATYNISPRTDIRLNGKAATIESLRGKLVVEETISGTTLTSLNATDVPRKITTAEARSFLLGATIVEFAVILLIVTNAAASTVTREKEDGTLDLLLTTPITSRYYIWGKLRGLVSYVLPLVAVPVVSVLIFVIYDFGRQLFGQNVAQWIVFPEAVLILPGMLIIVAAFASILGMQMSLRCRTTVRAVMSSVGIVVGACSLLGFCGYSLLEQRMPAINFALASFSPFTVMTVLIDPYQFGGRTFDGAHDADILGARIVLGICSIIATGAYAMLVWAMYRSMVKNFDMTIRRQSR